MINIATDGSCLGNPGPGGWGVAIFNSEGLENSISGGAVDTTNNRMELIAFIEACKWIEKTGCNEDITFWIDSTYVIKGATEWLRSWWRRDFRGVKNADLWREIAEMRNIWRDCKLCWVKGHNGHEYNEAADALARAESEKIRESNEGW